MRNKWVYSTALCAFFVLLVIFVKDGYSQLQGKCGDGVCDDFEKTNPKLCPQDCGPKKATARVKKTEAKPVTANVTVDYSNTLGTFSPYIFGALADPRYNKAEYPLVKDIGLKLVEILAPSMPIYSADINDQSRYNFTVLDKQIGSLVNIGVEPLLWFPLDKKPDSPENYAVYVTNVVKHLNQGLWNGHKWNVRVFRFGNEPDSPPFWDGTQQEFFEAYAAAAKALKKMDTNYVLDNAGLMNGVDNRLSDKATLSPWVTNFLAYAKKNNVPIDIFSIHAYGAVPYYMFYNNFRLLSEELKKYPALSNLYGSPRAGNDEWNLMPGDMWSGSYQKQFDTAWPASHNVTALINMIEQGLQLSIAYTGAINGGQNDCHDFLLTDCNNKPKPAYYALKGFNQLAGTMRLSTTGTDHMNFATIAGKSANVVTIVFSNYDVGGFLNKYTASAGPSQMEYDTYISDFGVPNTYNKFSLTINNLPWTSSQNVAYEHYLVDDKHNLGIVESKTVSGDKTISYSGEMTAPSVHIIKIYLK